MPERTEETPDSISSTLNVLHRISPNLISIKMNVPLDDTSTHTLLQFPHLKSLHRVRIADLDVFASLSNQPGIVSLGIKCTDVKVSPFVLSQQPRALRSSDLVELSLRGPCTALATLLKSLRAPSLRRASLVLRGGSLQQDARTLGSMGYASCMDALVIAAPALEEVFIHMGGSWQRSLGEHFRTLLAVGSLSRFVYKQTGKARLPPCHTGTDADFAAVGRAWGALEVLRLSPTSYFWQREGPVPSALVLAHLQASCRRLTTLVLPALDPCLDRLAAADSLPRPTTAPLRALSIRLWQLKSADITEEQEARWEAFLVGLFPQLAPLRGEKELISGEIHRRRRRRLVVRSVSTSPYSGSESAWDSSDDELFTSSYRTAG